MINNQQLHMQLCKFILL